MNKTENVKNYRSLLVKHLMAIIIFALISTGIFFIVSRDLMNNLFSQVENQHKQNLSQIVTIARNSIEPVMIQFRSGNIGKDEAVKRIRSMIRLMTYEDQYGDNYIFMSSYKGIMLVQPFEPSKELTDQWNLMDVNGQYIIRELVRAAVVYPEGSFVTYYYGLPGVHNAQEKLAYVIGLPEIECYIGTGMYMQSYILEQKEILKNVNHSFVWLIIAVLIPVMMSITIILNRNRGLLAEIKSRERAEEELKKSESKYRSIFENVMEGLFQTSVDGKFISVNPALARILGYSNPQELIDSTENIGIQFYEDPEERVKYIKYINDKGYAKNYIIKLKRKDGRFIWGSTNSRVITDDQGNTLYYEGSIEDVTERINAEEMSRQSEDKFMKVFMTSPDGIVISRMEDGRFIDINPGFEEIAGWKKNEIIGRTSFEIKFWVDPSARKLLLEELYSGKDVRYKELMFRRRDGEVRQGIYSAKSIVIGDELCIVFVMRDITEQMRLEDERRKFEQQFYQSQKMDAIGKLAGGVAHDFNNILTGIQGNISLMMLKYDSQDPQYQRLSRIDDQIKRGANLTRQLFDFAKEGQNEIRTISMNDLIRKSAMLFIETRKGIEVDLRLKEDLPPVDADPGQIEQVLLNLYINAGHAMPGGGSLLIQTFNIILSDHDVKLMEVDPGNYVKISVTDTGTGIDPEIQKRVFEPFFTTKEEQGGTGLGLASSYGIIRKHRGIINVYSEPGHGSTFNIFLPASKAKIDSEDSVVSKELLSGTGGILLIDDEMTILDSAGEMLYMLGYTVFKAVNGEEGLSVYKEKQKEINLVILDMIMPGMNGIQVMEILKTINPDVKIIFSSGNIQQGQELEVIKSQCCGFIQKPYTFNALSDIVHDAIYK